MVVCDKGEEAVAAVTGAVREHGIRAAQVTAVGGFGQARLGFFDRDARNYAPIPVGEQVEVLSLVGDVAEQDDQPVVHLHAVLGRRDGSTIGGHLLRGEVWPENATHGAMNSSRAASGWQTPTRGISLSVTPVPTDTWGLLR